MASVFAFLSHPADLLDAHADPRSAGRIVPPLLACLAAGGALFGLAVGSYHGGMQILYGALKMPLVLAAPLLVTLPALRVLHDDAPLLRAGLAALVCTARVAVLAAALAPVIWLVCSLDPAYPVVVLGMAGALVVVGAPNLWLLGRLLSPGRGAFFSTVLLAGITLAQAGWLLRPFVVTPGAPVTFLCPVRGDILDGLWARITGEVLFEAEIR